MFKRKLVLLLVLLAIIILGAFAFVVIANEVRESLIADLDEYYQEAARRECGKWAVLNPMNGCLGSVQMAAENRELIVEDGRCPDGYIRLGIACGPGCVGVCHPKIFNSLVEKNNLIEKEIAGLPEYYKEAARRECGDIDTILEMKKCLNKIQEAAETNEIIAENGSSCPAGYQLVVVLPPQTKYFNICIPESEFQE